MINRIEIKLSHVRPNTTFIKPLYSGSGQLVLEARTPLSTVKKEKIRQEYGNIVYQHSEGHSSPFTYYREEGAENARKIMHEISKTDKLSYQTYVQTERVIEQLLSTLNTSECKALDLVNELKSLDDYLYQHSVNVGMLTAVFARFSDQFTDEEIKYITVGSYLIDIGMMKVDEQLLKKKEKFDVSDIQKMQRHPQLGYEMLRKLPDINPIVMQTVLFHHEKYNNRGYYRIPYDRLPLYPKIAAASDIYDALTTARRTRGAFSHSDAQKIMVNMIYHNFDKKHVYDFLNILGPRLNNSQMFYSIGDLCELSTGELALIKNYAQRNIMDATVFIVCRFERHDKRRTTLKFYPQPLEIDLSRDTDREITKFLNNEKQIELIKNKLAGHRMLAAYIN